MQLYDLQVRDISGASIRVTEKTSWLLLAGEAEEVIQILGMKIGAIQNSGDPNEFGKNTNPKFNRKVAARAT